MCSLTNRKGKTGSPYVKYGNFNWTCGCSHCWVLNAEWISINRVFIYIKVHVLNEGRKAKTPWASAIRKRSSTLQHRASLTCKATQASTIRHRASMCHVSNVSNVIVLRFSSLIATRTHITWLSSWWSWCMILEGYYGAWSRAVAILKANIEFRLGKRI